MINLKTALVTGVSGEIGRAIALDLIKQGYRVACHYNSNDKAIRAFIEELRKQRLDSMAYFVRADFTDNLQVESVYERAKNKFGDIDTLINCAGIDVYKQIQDTTSEDFDKLFNINVKSAYTLSRLAVANMVSNRRGNIVFISSIWGVSGASMETLYSASKSALIGLGKALAKEVAPSGVRVNVVCPGVIDTKMNGIFSPEEMQEIKNSIPLGRLGKAEEIASLVSFLVSEKANYITGQAITVDGGYIL